MKHPLWILLAAFVMSISSAANGTPGDILVTQGDRVEVYDAPSSAAQVLITVDEGRKLKELRREGVWIKVLVFGEIGLDGWVQDTGVVPESARPTNAAQPDAPADDSINQEETLLGPHFVLVITGTPQQQFQVRCKAGGRYGGEVTKQKTIVEQVPQTYEIPGVAVSCRVRRIHRWPGALKVDFYDQGRANLIGTAQTRAETGCISARSKGRWGNAWVIDRCTRDRSNW